MICREKGGKLTPPAKIKDYEHNAREFLAVAEGEGAKKRRPDQAIIAIAQVYASLAIAEELREIRKELRRSDDDLNEAFRELMRRSPGV